MASETSSAAPSPTNTNSSSNFFSPGGEPPLILAFLAIGVFTASMVAVFGWRRASLVRVWPIRDTRMQVGSSRWREDFGKRPDLWDLRAEQMTSESGWDNIMPFSAALTSTVLPSAKDDSYSGETPTNTQRHQFRELHRRYRKSNIEGDAIIDAKMSNTHLQVAVVIALPSPRSLNRPSTTEGPYRCARSTDEEDECLDYSNGIFETPWHKQEK